MAFEAYQVNANALYQPVNQAAHGFDNGDVVRWNGAAWVLAQSDAAANCGLIHIVSLKINANSFYVTQAGYISGLVRTPINPAGSFVAGTTYYLSETTQGRLTATPPTGINQVLLPCFKAYDATSGFFFGNDGTEIESGNVFNWNIVNADQALAVNNGYLITAAAPLSFDLPAVSVVGDVIKLATSITSTDSILIAQDNNQYIVIAEESSTVGPTGGMELETTNGIRRGSCELLCIEANLGWRLFSGTGTWDLI